MKAIRSINNNIAVCIDSTGVELIAMGKGIGYGKMPHEVDLDDVTHTYYSVDERQLEGVRTMPAEVLDFAATMNDWVRAQLSYQLGPQLRVHAGRSYRFRHQARADESSGAHAALL